MKTKIIVIREFVEDCGICLVNEGINEFVEYVKGKKIRLGHWEDFYFVPNGDLTVLDKIGIMDGIHYDKDGFATRDGFEPVLNGFEIGYKGHKWELVEEKLEDI